MNETLRSVDGRTELRIERRLGHAPAKVWRALTEPSELAAWFPAVVELDLRLDGRIAFSFEQGEDGFVEDPDNAGVIRAYDPPRLLEYNWGVEVLRWELEPDGDGCVMTLTATFDDRPAAASYTAGWLGCFSALDLMLGGSGEEPVDYAPRHEHYVAKFGLDAGTITRTAEEWTIRFERQFAKPKERIWAHLSGGRTPAPGQPAPQGFVAKGIEPGPVAEVSEPTSLVCGPITWKLRDGNGGARVILTHTGPLAEDPAEPYDAWHDLLEAIADQA
ncbi:SRPBCC family protein [Kribbella deserti]|uniref:SRPBCC family protein n=1 Tax=Kribbella deserti TaxID=1926257 RepID=A0ABV6QM87_9ACTN